MPETIDLEKQLMEWNLHREAIFARLDNIPGSKVAASLSGPFKMISYFCFGVAIAEGDQPLDTSKLKIWNQDKSLAQAQLQMAREVYTMGYEFGRCVKGEDFFEQTSMTEAVMINLLTYFGGNEAVQRFYKVFEEVRH